MINRLVIDIKNLKAELIRIKTKDHLELHGLLFEPTEKTNKILVHVHGWTGNFYENVFIDFVAKESISNKISFLTFNTRGAGHVQEFLRKENSKVEYIKIGGSLEKFEDCVIDIEAVIEFLDKRGYKNIILQGHSTGCQKITYYKYKTKDERVKGLVLLEPTDDPDISERFLGDRYSEAMKIARKMIRDGRENEPMPNWIPFGINLSVQKFLSMSDSMSIEGRLFNYSGELKEIQELDCPSLAIFGAKTEYQKNPGKQLEILKKKMKKCEIKLIQNANHWFFNHELELGKIIVDCINTKLFSD